MLFMFWLDVVCVLFIGLVVNMICLVLYGLLLGLVVLLVFVRFDVVMFRCCDCVDSVELVMLKMFINEGMEVFCVG